MWLPMYPAPPVTRMVMGRFDPSMPKFYAKFF
jgi:hypothetical protein